MAQTEVRPRIVALLCDADFIYRTDTRTWSHLDGRPFTYADQVIARQATPAELEEARERIKRDQDYRRTQGEVTDVLVRYLDPLLDHLGEQAGSSNSTGSSASSAHRFVPSPRTPADQVDADSFGVSSSSASSQR